MIFIKEQTLSGVFEALLHHALIEEHVSEEAGKEEIGAVILGHGASTCVETSEFEGKKHNVFEHLPVACFEDSHKIVIVPISFQFYLS